jgi:hypothetical protein
LFFKNFLEKQPKTKNIQKVEPKSNHIYSKTTQAYEDTILNTPEALIKKDALTNDYKKVQNQHQFSLFF